MKNNFWIVPMLVGFLGVSSAHAQWREADSYPPGERPAADAGIGVARVSVSDGEVEVRRGQSGDRLQAKGGMPVLGDTTVTTGRSSRAELQFGQGNFVRLNEETAVRVVEIGNRYFHLEVLEGNVTYSQLKGGESDATIGTPVATVYPLKPGEYRLGVRPGSQTDITVRKGQAEVASSNGAEKLKKGRRMTIRGDVKSAEFRTVEAGSRDSFDEWAKRRDKMLEQRSPRWGGGWYPRIGVGLGYGWGGYGGYGWPYLGLGGGYIYRSHGGHSRGRGGRH